MGKTNKDKANYYRFKDKRDEAPKEVRELIDRMDESLYSKHTPGYRFGNNRKQVAKVRKKLRKAKRNNKVDIDKE